MTMLSNSQDVEAAVRQRHFVSDREAQGHRDLALELHGQLFDRFGPVPDVLLVQLAQATREQLTDYARELGKAASLESFVARVGFTLPQGGEGNYPIDLTYRVRRGSFVEQRQVQERLACLRSAQPVRELRAPEKAFESALFTDSFHLETTPI